MTKGINARDARLHILSLAEFRQAVDGKWGRLSQLTQVAVGAIARNHMNLQNDIFTQFDAEISLLVIPNVPRQQVRSRVAAIAKDVAGQLFGDAVIHGRRPQVILTNIPLNQALNAGGQLDNQAIHTAVDKAGALVSPPPPPATPQQEPLSAPCRATLASLMQEKGSPLAALLNAPATAGTPDWFQSQIDAQTAAQQVTAMSGDSKLTLLWAPTWVTALGTIGAFHAHLVRSDNEAAPPLEGCHAYDNANPVEALTMDRFVATRTAQELKRIYFQGQHTGLTMPIHWMSLSPRWRECVRMPIMECPENARRRLLKIEIFGLSSGVPARMFGYMFEPIQAMGCDVMVRLGLNQLEMIPLLRSVKAVGVDLAELQGKERVGDTELFRRIDAFRKMARDHQLACYIWGARHRPLVQRVLTSGFSLINGPGVMCNLSHPAIERRNPAPKKVA